MAVPKMRWNCPATRGFAVALSGTLEHVARW